MWPLQNELTIWIRDRFWLNENELTMDWSVEQWPSTSNLSVQILSVLVKNGENIA